MRRLKIVQVDLDTTFVPNLLARVQKVLSGPIPDEKEARSGIARGQGYFLIA
jgi:hypothetical protein